MTASGPYLAEPVGLSPLADRSGEVEWGRLAALAAGCDVVVGEVLDEELVVCRALAGLAKEPDPHWTPRRDLAREDQLTSPYAGGSDSVPGLWTCDGGVVCDLGGMRGAEVDPAAPTARVEQ